MAILIRRSGTALRQTVERYSELIMDGLKSFAGEIQGDEFSAKPIEELFLHPMLERDEPGGLARLSPLAMNVFNHVLISARLQMVNANLGVSFKNVQNQVEQYSAFENTGEVSDCEAIILQGLNRQVTSLCDELADQAREIRRQVHSDFRFACHYSTRMALDAETMGHIRQTHEAIVSADMDGLYEICGQDRVLMELIYSRIRLARENCLRELGEAISFLNRTIFISPDRFELEQAEMLMSRPI